MQAALDFLRELSVNNNREWFAENRPRFDAIQQDLLGFIEALLQQLAHQDERMLDIAPKNCLFRIHRDARFSKGQSPYKTHFGIHMVTSGDRADQGRAGYYLHIAPGASMLAGGAHSPTPAWLKRIRANLAEHGGELTRIVGKAEFRKTFGEVQGERLVRAPVGWPVDHPQIDWLRYKALTVWHPVSDADLCSQRFMQHCVRVFGVYRPFRDFLNKP